MLFSPVCLIHHVQMVSTMWSIHVLWITVAVSSFVQCLVILECVAANPAFSCPVMERRVLTSMSVQAMEGRVTASMLAQTPSAPECAPAQLDTSFLQTECLAKVSIVIKLLLHCISNGPIWSCSIYIIFFLAMHNLTSIANGLIWNGFPLGC